MYRSKFKSKYGELIICNDSTNYWRKEIFPLYKAKRKRDMDKSDMDWNNIFSIMDKIRREVKEIFPYKNLRVERTEADDIIAVLCREYHETEKIVIISNDKDFQQLQRYPNVKQFSPMKKKYLVCENPESFLLEHIIKGDSSDGIPNILSDDDVFINKEKRQKPCGGKKVNQIMENLSEWQIETNWERNQNLIDMNKIPDIYINKILEEYNISGNQNRGQLLDYFIENNLRNLISSVGDF